MSGSRIITGDGDRLANVHPGDILREDFLVGTDIPTDDVRHGTGLGRAYLDEVLAGASPIDADADIRLARYFGMTEGFFLGLQNDYDLEEAWLASGPELDRIVRRAA